MVPRACSSCRPLMTHQAAGVIAKGQAPCSDCCSERPAQSQQRVVAGHWRRPRMGHRPAFGSTPALALSHTSKSGPGRPQSLSTWHQSRVQWLPRGESRSRGRAGGCANPEGSPRGISTVGGGMQYTAPPSIPEEPGLDFRISKRVCWPLPSSGQVQGVC